MKGVRRLNSNTYFHNKLSLVTLIFPGNKQLFITNEIVERKKALEGLNTTPEENLFYLTCHSGDIAS